MKNVVFKKVVMENFGPYIEPMEIEFDSNKLILISGPNGIGKTMLLDSIPYCLYGITSKGLKGDDVVNNITEKNCKVVLDFYVDTDLYKIKRYHKHSKYRNTVLLFKNNMDEPIMKGHKEVLPEVERITNVSRKLFMNTLMFGQKVKDFFTDLTDTEKKEIFRKILELDNYVLYNAECIRTLKINKERLTKANSDIYINNNLLNESNEQIQRIEVLKKNFKSEQQILIANIQLNLTKFLKLKEQLKITLGEYDKIDLNTESTTEEITNLRNRINKINTDKEQQEKNIKDQSQIEIDSLHNQSLESESNNTNKCQEFINELNSKYLATKENFDNNIFSLREKITEIQNKKTNEENFIVIDFAEITKITNNVIEKEISTCPTCFQEINKETIQKLTNRINDLNLKNNNRRIQIKGLEEQTNQLESLLIQKTEEFKNINNLYTNKLDEVNKIKNEESETIQNLLKQKTEIINQSMLISINEIIALSKIEKESLESSLLIMYAKLEKQKQMIKEKMESKNSLKEKEFNIISLQKLILEKRNEKFDEEELNLCKIKIESFHSAIKNLELEKEKIDIQSSILEFWASGCSSSGIPSMLIDEAIPYMNQRVSYYLDQISNGRYVVSFDTLSSIKSGEIRDKISVNMYDNKTKANSKLQFSGGQTRIVDIAAILTLSDLQAKERGVSFNLLLFDEIMDALDLQNIELVSNMLRQIVKNKTICLISHKYIDHIEADVVLNLT